MLSPLSGAGFTAWAWKEVCYKRDTINLGLLPPYGQEESVVQIRWQDLALILGSVFIYLKSYVNSRNVCFLAGEKT